LRFSKTFLITAIAALAPIATFADSVKVTSNPTLSVAGLSFGDFTCSVTKGGISATPSHCNQINVAAITNPGNGIQFTSGFFAAPLSFDDAALTYNVASAAGITSVNLDFNGTFFGLAVSSVTESIFSDGHLLKTASVSCDLAGCNRTDQISLDGVYHNLHVEKDIYTGAFLGTAQSSIIDQTFAQTPEPGSIALMGIGLLAAGGLLRRRTVQALRKDQ
jgi:hypothetical protein